jgi:hypothetical protein
VLHDIADERDHEILGQYGFHMGQRDAEEMVEEETKGVFVDPVWRIYNEAHVIAALASQSHSQWYVAKLV